MKNYIFTLIAIAMVATSATAQNITFEDPDTLQGMLDQEPSIDTNNDGQISEAEAAEVTFLDLDRKFIDVFPEAFYFTALEEIILTRNFLEGTLDLSQNPELRIVIADNANFIDELILYTDGPSKY
ncbi:hypothetical protein EAX61_02580 [Dokdonia sinensis]|uniref:EF-hand domain-containing protein n=1 Tax=Dokdonia sinensis TaxID=2479847 RepID=A0A3M0H129_9FLAO|nr:hypothetical protein [Dokdonia sinensis]RMB63296.1 hypothetical protein EAX61_02580 [Dokdonia sinensis]